MTRKQLRQFNKIISITEELFKKQDEGIRNFLIEDLLFGNKLQILK